jgi:hypothetical protein
MDSMVPATASDMDLDAIAELSDDEIERRLMARLSGQDQG